jgi:hypothetical protein
MLLKSFRVFIAAQARMRKAGGNVNIEYRQAQKGFTTADILWAIGIWSVIITLSPVIVFYMLMVA